MILSELRASVCRQLAACLQQCSHGDGDDPGEPWWVVMAETCTDLDITRQEQMDIGIFYISLLLFTKSYFRSRTWAHISHDELCDRSSPVFRRESTFSFLLKSPDVFYINVHIVLT